MKKTFALVLLGLLACSSLFARENLFIGRSVLVDGKSLDDYANLWWQWAQSMPNSESPVVDTTGSKCATNQNGPVWFLAGGYGTSKISRKCAIPAGKYLFFPVINMLYYSRSSGSISCQLVKKQAAINNNLLTSFIVDVDGQKSLNPALHRHQSPQCFDLLAAIPKVFNPPRTYPSATDGYWVMLSPLSEGTHRIYFRAEYDNRNAGYGLMFQDIEYELEVKSAEGLLTP